MKEIFLIVIMGFVILIGAIIINLLASFLGLVTWHDLLISVNKKGLNEFFVQGFLSNLYLYVIYPLLLGLLSYYSYNLLK